MRYSLTLAALGTLALALSAQAQPATRPAQPAATAPASAPAQADVGKGLKATVVSVTGQAQKMSANTPDAKWGPLLAGQELDELTVVRTGLRSQAVIRLSDRGEVVIESATKMGLAELRQRGTLVTARIGLKYGLVRATVESARGPNDVRVATPTATLAVRHSKADVGFTEVGLGLQVRQSPWQVRNVNFVRTFYPGQITDDNLTPWCNLAPLLRAIYLGDQRGLTQSEKDFLANYGQGRGQLRFMNEMDTRYVRQISYSWYLYDLLPCDSWIRQIIARRHQRTQY